MDNNLRFIIAQNTERPVLFAQTHGQFLYSSFMQQALYSPNLPMFKTNPEKHKEKKTKTKTRRRTVSCMFKSVTGLVV